MKKFLLSLMCVCLCGTFAFADVVVMVKNKTVKYPDGTKLNFKAKNKTIVMYKDTVVIIPKGEEVSIDCPKNTSKGAMIVSSDKGFKGVQIGDKVFNSKRPIKLVVANNGWINVESGTAAVKNGKGDVFIAPEGKGTAVNTKPSDQELQGADSAETAGNADTSKAAGIEGNAELSDSTDVAEIEKNDTKYEQVVRDLASDTDLSPSAPRN